MMERIGRNDPCPCGSGKKYKQCCGASVAITPEHAEAHYRLGSTLQDQGRLREAIASYGTAVSLKPDHAQAHNNLGTVFEALGELENAAASYRRALDSSPPSPYFHYNLGSVLQALGRLDDAIVHYDKALSLKPDFAQAHYNLANALKDQDKLPQAIASYGKALSLKPDLAEAHNNLGWVLQAQGHLDDAIASYRKALSLIPAHATTHYNLGTVFRTQGRLEEAAGAFRKVLSSQPDRADVHNDLGNVLNELGQIDAALASYQRALALEEDPEFKMSFAQCIRNVDFIRIDRDVRRLVARALSEPWARPGDLATTGIKLIKLDQGMRECIERAASAWPARPASRELFGPQGPAALSDDPLLRSLLESSPVPDVAMERFLTMARHALLDEAIGAGIDDDPQNDPAAFYCALARQCLINDFVFSPTDDELHRAISLRDRLVVALEAGKAVPPLWVVAVAAYFPLLSLPSAQALLNQRWPESVGALLTQHIAEPLQERQYRDAMPRLTGVEDGVSHSVRQQYEESPYPRWIKLPPPGKALSMDAYLRRRFPYAPRHRFDQGHGLDLLVAGCGTGLESIELARQFQGARVLAVDLSVSSLGYAKRKTLELGLKDIEYAQGDIVKLGSIGRTFDLISSVGVLHHLADPVAGLRELLALLRPGGFMFLGLYSECARRDVVAARRFIAERGYASDAAGIRRCRQDLMSMEDDVPLKQVTSFSDFYVTSECRDLLFHVQERRFTLPRIKEILAGFGLDFVGFLVEPHVMKKYKERFAHDPAGTDLDCWNDFEAAFPNTFAAMYVFLVQKPDARDASAPERE
jgi:tetratricopeptide (TPR) repeat protein/SAM-dependent methyltransferase